MNNNQTKCHIINRCINSYSYSEKNMNTTGYHTFDHVRQMLRLLKEHAGDFKLTLSQYEQLYHAICFHDISYIPGADDNEIKSANIWFKNYKNIHSDIDDDIGIGVYYLILSTNYSQFEFKGLLYDIIHDLDWYVFSSLDLVSKYNDLISIEYDKYILSEKYLNGRIQFLLDIYSKDRLFKTDLFNDKFGNIHKKTSLYCIKQIIDKYLMV